MIGADAPLLVYQSSRDHPLLLLARQSGWQVESADAVDPAVAVSAAACIASTDAEVERFRALCPDSVCIGTSTALESVDVVDSGQRTDQHLSEAVGARQSRCRAASRDPPRRTRFRRAPRSHSPARRHRYRAIRAARSGQAIGDVADAGARTGRLRCRFAVPHRRDRRRAQSALQAGAERHCECAVQRSALAADHRFSFGIRRTDRQ